MVNVLGAVAPGPADGETLLAARGWVADCMGRTGLMPVQITHTFIATRYPGGWEAFNAVHATVVTVGGGSMMGHRCDPDGQRVDMDRWPIWADPGHVVKLRGQDWYGRVRLAWRCCGSVLVESMVNQDDPECSTTHTGRYVLETLRPPVLGVSYSVPCIGAEWSLHLPCGHMHGEGCAFPWCGDVRPEHTCGPGINVGCDMPGCDGDVGD